METYDYIIVGAGSSGSVLARKLSDDSRRTVLLIEDGGENTSPFIRMAGGFMKVFGKPEYFRSFPVVQQYDRRKEFHSYGRGLGGSSAINGTWYLPGAPGDYDLWRDMGLPDWSWDEMAPCLKEVESYRAAGAAPERGRDGPLQITQADYAPGVLDALIAACRTVGLTWVDDIAAPGQCGIGRSQYTVDRRGRRATSFTAFVAPVRSRPNLRIETHCRVQRLEIVNGRVTGIVCESDGAERRFAARNDVIVSAGIYGSPHLLQVSGIGNGEDLTAAGVPVRHDLPAVGRNFADHQKLGITFDLHNHPGTNREFGGWRLYRNALRYFAAGNGPLARVGMPLTGMYASDGNCRRPDFQLALSPFAMRTVKEMTEHPGSPITPRPGLTIGASHLHPKSRGKVRLTSPDIRDAPLVDPAMWRDPADRDSALFIFRKLREIAAAPVLQQYIGAERFPGAGVTSDEELLDELRRTVDVGLHGVGTCRMGIDTTTSVTDGHCRVHGLSGLRVVDTSIMPTTMSGNTSGPAMLVAARAARLIADDHS